MNLVTSFRYAMPLCRVNSCRWLPIRRNPVGIHEASSQMRSVLLAPLPLVLAPSAALAQKEIPKAPGFD